MAELGRRPTFSELLSAVQEPVIVLQAIAGLRWLAVVGQLTATAVAIWGLGLVLPVAPIASVILGTALSNILLHLGMRYSSLPGGLVPTILLLDVLLLTELLYFTGGPQNPFSVLYLVHVAMAVIVLPRRWTWVVVATVGAGYAALLRWHWPLTRTPPVPDWVLGIGSWLSLVLVAALVVAFIGWVIRALRQREEELVQMRERASKNEQLAALTTLAAGAAHELGTPLGTIAVVAKELEITCGSQSQYDAMREDAKLIRQEVERCRHILSRMRFDIGEDVSKRSKVDVRQLGERLTENFSDRERARLSIRYEPGVETVQAPPRALEQALLVLLRNAFDASPRNTEVVMEVTRQEGHVRFEVQDKGIGMSKEMLRRAGEPFYTTKEPGRGMGLGLFLVRLVAERCGAEFVINSKEGEGTRCTFELPDARMPW